jgi:hypothetical protein
MSWCAACVSVCCMCQCAVSYVSIGRMCLRVLHVSACVVCVSVLFHVSECLHVPHVSACAV